MMRKGTSTVIMTDCFLRTLHTFLPHVMAISSTSAACKTQSDYNSPKYSTFLFLQSVPGVLFKTVEALTALSKAFLTSSGAIEKHRSRAFFSLVGCAVVSFLINRTYQYFQVNHYSVRVHCY